MEQYTVGSAVKQMSVHMANLYYYITKEMADTFGTESTKKVLEKAITEFGHARGKAIAERVLLDGGGLTIENLDKYYDIPITQGWDVNRVYKDNTKENTTDSCIFADTWLEKDWAEIGKIYCLVDIAIREGYNRDVVFKPIKNILDGDDCCTSITVHEQPPEK